MLGLLPLLIALGYAFYTFSGLIKYDLQLKHICRAQGLQAMESVGDHLQKLLQLNNHAASLRNQYITAKTKLALALATENPIAIAAAELRLQKIELQRLTLDTKQKLIIAHANRVLSVESQKIRINLSEQAIKHQGRWHKFLEVKTRFKKIAINQLSVAPDRTDIAPLYNTVNNFADQQAMVFSWQILFSAQEQLKNFLQTKGQLQRTCAITLEEVEKMWHAKLHKADRFL